MKAWILALKDGSANEFRGIVVDESIVMDWMERGEQHYSLEMEMDSFPEVVSQGIQ